MPSRVSFFIKFLKHCGKVKSLETGYARACLLLNSFAPTKPLFVSVEYHGDHKTVIKIR